MAGISFEKYKPDEIEKYRAERRGTRQVEFDYYLNNVYFDDANKQFFIVVDESKEFGYFDDVGSKKEPSSEEDEESYELSFSNWKTYLAEKESEESESEKTETEVQEDNEEGYNRLNHFSGLRVTIPLGEGIIDFCCADFEKHKDMLSLFFVLPEAIKKYEMLPPEEMETLKSNEPYKAEDHKDLFDYKLERFSNVFMMGSSFFYNSFYSAVFPPCFIEYSFPALQHFSRYLSVLQKEYQELLEFCFDVDFYPEELKNLTCVDRYRLYCMSHEHSTSFMRTEYFQISQYDTNLTAAGYKYSVEEIKDRLSSVKLSKTKNAFEEKYNLKKNATKYVYMIPYAVNVKYKCTSLYEILSLEFSKMLELGVRVKKCKNCSKYFILKGNYQTEYCDRIPDGETRNCQTIASLSNYKNKIKSDEAWKVYNKFYKRYFARMKVGIIKAPAFKAWNYEAVVKRDSCSEGALPIKEFIDWMECAFPNRRK